MIQPCDKCQRPVTEPRMYLEVIAMGRSSVMILCADCGKIPLGAAMGCGGRFRGTMRVPSDMEATGLWIVFGGTALLSGLIGGIVTYISCLMVFG